MLWNVGTEKPSAPAAGEVGAMSPPPPGVAWIAVLVELDWPFESVTVSVALYVPATYVCDCARLLSVQVASGVPSPKTRRRPVIGALPAVEPEALNDTASGAVPEPGVALSCA